MQLILVFLTLFHLCFCGLIYASDEELNNGIQILNKFNSIKNYTREAKVFEEEKLQAIVKTKFFYPSYLKEETTIFPDSSNPVSRVLISNGKDLWFYQLSSHQIFHKDINIPPDSQFNTIRYEIPHPLSVSFHGEGVVNNIKVNVVKIIGFDDKENKVKTYFLSFEKDTGLLLQIESDSDKDRSDLNIFDVEFGNSQSRGKIKVKIRRLFYNYKFNNKFKREEFDFNVPDNFKKVETQANHFRKETKEESEKASDERNLEYIRIYSEAIKVEPKDVSLYFGRAKRYAKSGNFLKAIEDYKKVIELDPSEWEAIYTMAYCLAQIGNDGEAIINYTKTIELNPKAVNAYINRALTYEKQNKSQLALQDLNQAIDIDPSNSYAYSVRAYVYESLKNYDRAWADIKKVEKLGGSIDMDLFNRLNLTRQEKIVGNLSK